MYDALRNEITATNWNDLIDDTIDVYCSNVSNRIASLADKYIPNKNEKIITSDPSWNNNIHTMIRKRRGLYKKVK